MPQDLKVTRLPLERLPGDDKARRERLLSKTNLRELLRLSPVAFLVADVGHPLKRVEAGNCFAFWKAEVEPHIVDNASAGFRLDDFASHYAYVASEWSGDFKSPVVLLEKRH